jgi:hypothetical protein
MPTYTRRTMLASSAALPMLEMQRESRNEGPPEKHLLAGGQSAAGLLNALIPLERWTPYPRCADRGAWEALPA